MKHLIEKTLKNIIVVTGSKFVGSNLIHLLIKKTKFKIISLDNYSTGSRKNHIISNKVIYLKGHTKDISKLLKKYLNKIHTIFHFGEFAEFIKVS